MYVNEGEKKRRVSVSFRSRRHSLSVTGAYQVESSFCGGGNVVRDLAVLLVGGAFFLPRILRTGA